MHFLSLRVLLCRQGQLVRAHVIALTKAGNPGVHGWHRACPGKCWLCRVLHCLGTASESAPRAWATACPEESPDLVSIGSSAPPRCTSVPQFSLFPVEAAHLAQGHRDRGWNAPRSRPELGPGLRIRKPALLEPRANQGPVPGRLWRSGSGQSSISPELSGGFFPIWGKADGIRG